MKQLVLLVGLCIGVTGAAIGGENVKPLSVGVYVGEGVQGVGPGRWLQLLESTGGKLKAEPVDAQGICRGEADKYPLVLLPDGDAKKMAAALGSAGRAKIQDFIEKGGACIASGAGARLLVQGGVGWGLVPWKTVFEPPRNPTQLSTYFTSSVTNYWGLRKGGCRVWYNCGPVLEPGAPVPGAKFEMVAKFRGDINPLDAKSAPPMTGAPSLLLGTYGRGRVAVVVDNPEINAQTFGIVRAILHYTLKTEVAFDVARRQRGQTSVGCYCGDGWGVERARRYLRLLAAGKEDVELLDEGRIAEGLTLHLDEVDRGGERVPARPAACTAAPSAEKSAKVRAAIYADRGVSCAEFWNVSKLIFCSPLYDVTFVDHHDIANGVVNAKDFDMLLMSGGPIGVQEAIVGESGRAAVTNFVRQGGAYYGICAGTFSALQSVDPKHPRFALVPYKNMPNQPYRGWCNMNIRFTQDAKVALGFEPDSLRQVLYWGGPVMVPAEVPADSDIRPLAYYHGNVVNTFAGGAIRPMAGSVAVAGGRFGKGKVLCSAVHPECEEATRDIVKRYLKYLTGRPAEPVYTQHHKGAVRVAFCMETATKAGMAFGMELARDPRFDVRPVTPYEVNQGLLEHIDVLFFPWPEPRGYMALLHDFIRKGGRVVELDPADKGVVYKPGVYHVKDFEEARGVMLSTSSFAAAKPVWPAGRETKMNDFVGFRATFNAKAGERAMLRITGSSIYRVRLNGKVVGYGPARAAKGFFRVGEWPLASALQDGANTLAIEVSAYNCNNFYIPDQPAFLQAEVLVDGKVVAATGAKGGFEATDLPRVVKSSRFSFQRAFTEYYRLAPGCDAWATGGAVKPLALAEQPLKALVERIAPLPDLAVTRTLKAIEGTRLARKPEIKYRGERSVDKINPPAFKGYRPDELDLNVWRELQYHTVEPRPNADVQGASWRIAGSGVLFDNGFEDTGFPGLKVRCLKPGRLWLAFDEVLVDGKVDPIRFAVSNAVAWDLQPGEYELETFEAYSLRYLHVYTLDGEMEVRDLFMRDYKNPDAKRASFTSSDPDLGQIFAAARETFAQNAVDVFTDCPSRERAGWLCDSFFTARSSLLFTGSLDLERLFIQNYLLPEKFEHIPDGMLPMCYPSDHTDNVFIPNWAMWFVIEVDEYLVRGGDRATVDALKPRLVKLVNYLKQFRNSDGLLEHLPSWVFVEWSRCNSLTQDVNYPSNMTWAEVLDCMDRLYGMPELAAEAQAVRETVRRQSWNGKWFCDNAKRQPDGTLKLSGECTETCQYYAFIFKTATPETHAELWKTMLEDFGPQRRQTRKHPQIHFSNAFVGNYLRLEMLSRRGLDRQLLKETKGYFKYMADRTGTLWENDSAHASCNHGFASHAAVFYVKNILGISRIDPASKTVTVRRTDVDLDNCSATLPVPGGAVTYGWTRKDGKLDETFKAPQGWKLVRQPAH